MTDKEKINAIRAEVQNYIDAAHKAHTNITEGNFAHLLSFIDSLQEEPVSEDLNKAASRYAKKEYDRKSSATLPDRCRGCYAPLMYAFKAGAKWGKEQAMAEIKAQSMALVHGCPGESENDDLEEAAEDYGIKQGAELKPFAIKYFKAGAKWQKEQDQSTIELAEDHAMLAGMNKMEEQMLAKAVDVTVTGIREYKEENEVDFTLMLEKGTIPYELEEDIKVILIKKN